MGMAWSNYTKHVENDITAQNMDVVSGERTILYYRRHDAGFTANTSYAGLTSASFQPMGLIQSYNWMEQKQVETIWELGSSIPYLIPGRAQGQISLARVYLFNDIVAILQGKKVSGSTGSTISDVATLRDANQSFDIAIVMFSAQRPGTMSTNPDGSEPSRLTTTQSKVFVNCWINSRSESLAGGQLIVMEQVSILYEQVFPATWSN
jgi:hypothetical protein